MLPFAWIKSSAPSLEGVYLQNGSNDSLLSKREAKYKRARFEVIPNSKAFVRLPAYLKKYRLKYDNGTLTDKEFFHSQKEQLAKHAVSNPSSGVLLGLVGDVMWIGKAAPDYVSEGLLSYLEGFDVVIGNLESPIDSTRRVPHLLPDYLKYNSNPNLIRAFNSTAKEKNIFTALTLANNHTFDKGYQGMLETMNLLDDLGVKYAGVNGEKNEKKYVVIEAQGIRIGLFSATYGLNFKLPKGYPEIEVNQIQGLTSLALDSLDLEPVAHAIQQMRSEGVDFITIALHWGFEFEHYPDPFIRGVAHRIAQLGADLILGSHPHIMQPMEVIYSDVTEGEMIKNKQSLAIYSLGNFTSRMYTTPCQLGGIASIWVFKDENEVSWAFNELNFVYNSVPALPNKKHRIMLLHEYEKHYLGKPNKKNSRKQQEIYREVERVWFTK